MKPIKLLLLDVDGILTDGRLWFDQHGEALKCFHVHDGEGVKRLMRSGVQVGIISGRDCAALRTRLNELGINLYFLGVQNKLDVYQTLKIKLGLQDENIAYMGDDTPDLAVMKEVGFAITVPNAAQSIQAVADFKTTRHGGAGAVREACDHLLEHSLVQQP